MDRFTKLFSEPEFAELRGEETTDGVLAEDHSSKGQVSTEKTFTVEPSTRKLKNFSGAEKLGNGEIDYKHWRRAALRISEDLENMSAKERRKTMAGPPFFRMAGGGNGSSV